MKFKDILIIIEKSGEILYIKTYSSNDEGDVYIGSTTKQYLSQRMTAHQYCYKKFKNGKSNWK